MKKIPLSGKYGEGKFALVDDEDFERVSRYKWQLSPRGYVTRTARINGKKTPQSLHRFIMNAPKGVDVDHINRDKLDNRKCNLRFADDSQNNGNKPPRPGCTSKYKGVHWDPAMRAWRASIRKNLKRIYLGYYETEEEAAVAYNNKAIELFGEFAYLNDVPNDIVPKPISRLKKYSRFRGVTYRGGKWIARIREEHIGVFDSEIEAAYAYNEKAKELFGESAYLNPIPEDFVPSPKKKEKKFRGVYKKGDNKWEASIKHNHKRYYLGVFDSEIEAAKAYNAKALELLGDKAKLNIIPEEEESTE